MGDDGGASPPEVRKAQLPLLDLPTTWLDSAADQVLENAVAAQAGNSIGPEIELQFCSIEGGN